MPGTSIKKKFKKTKTNKQNSLLMELISKFRRFQNIENKYWIVQQVKILIFVWQHFTGSEVNTLLKSNMFQKKKIKISIENNSSPLLKI